MQILLIHCPGPHVRTADTGPEARAHQTPLSAPDRARTPTWGRLKATARLPDTHCVLQAGPARERVATILAGAVVPYLLL